MSLSCGQSPDDAQEDFNFNQPIRHSHIRVDPLSSKAPAQVVTLIQGILDQYHNSLNASESRLMRSRTHNGEPIKKKVETMVLVAQHARNTHKLLDQFAVQVLENVVPLAVVLERQKDRVTALKVVPISRRQMSFHQTQPDSGKITTRDNLATPDFAMHRQPSHAHDNHPTVRTDHADCQSRNQGHIHTSTQPHLGADATDRTGQGSSSFLAHSWTAGITQYAGIAKAFFLRLWPGFCNLFRHLVSFWTAVQNLAAINREAGGREGLRRTLTDEEADAINEVMADMRAYLEPDWEMEHSDEVLEALMDISGEGRLDAILNSGMLTDAESE